MKKVVIMSETEREAFLGFCEAVKNTEADKDTFLEAARLTRHEEKLDGNQIYWAKLTAMWVKLLSLFIAGAFICIALSIIFE